ncbi:MAG TPA: DMT family transporter [Isosphaeraceae bacterium]|jgi:drug/metabolite transporter (DMT)-like permease
MSPPESEPTVSGRLDATAVAAAVFCCAIWGGNAVAVKFSVPDLPPFGCAGLRFLIGLPVIAAACRGLGQTLRVGRPYWGLIALHAALTVLQIGTYNWGTSHSLAGRASVFINVHPLVVAPLAWRLLGERLDRRGLLGLGAAACGVLLLLATSLHVRDNLAGDLVVLASGVIFGVQTIAQKKTFPLIPPTTLLFAQSLLAIPLFLTYSAVVEGFGTYRFTPGAVGGLLYQGLAVSGLCFTTWMLLLRRYPAGRLATIAFLTPLFGVGLGHLTRGEALTWNLVVGGGLVGCGIFLVASDRAAHGREPDIALPGEDAP